MKRIIKRLTAMAMMILLLLQCIPINTYAQAQTVGETSNEEEANTTMVKNVIVILLNLQV